MVRSPGYNEIVYWNDKNGGFDRFSTSENCQSTLFDSVNPKKNIAFGFQSSQVVSKRIRLSTEFNEQEVELNSSEESSPLGLTLRKTTSFLNLVEMKLSQGRNTKMDDFASEPMSEKLKASNFPASLLKIGSWERISRHEGDLVVKCYYAKRKLVWEVLEGALKCKIEIQWSDILAIRAITGDDEAGILAIELNKPPSFFRESNPQPRKHTLWQQASDFTGGQAPFFRRHYVKFAPGVLDKHYEKLLQCDEGLSMLNQKPFPSLESPYFYSINGITGFSFNSSGCGTAFSRRQQHPFPSIPTPPFIAPHHVGNFKPTTGLPLSLMDSNSPLSVTEFSPGDEKICKYAFENQEKDVWGQRVNDIVHILGREDQNRGLPFTASVTLTDANTTFPCQDYLVSRYGEEAGRPNQNNGALTDIENHLLGDSQVVYLDESNVLDKLTSMCSFLEPLEEANAINIIDTNHLEYNQRNASDDRSILTTEHPKVDDLVVLYQQPIHCFPPLVSDEKNLRMHLPREDSSYPFVFLDPMVEESQTVDAAHEAHHWT